MVVKENVSPTCKAEENASNLNYLKQFRKEKIKAFRCPLLAYNMSHSLISNTIFSSWYCSVDVADSENKDNLRIQYKIDYKIQLHMQLNMLCGVFLMKKAA